MASQSTSISGLDVAAPVDRVEQDARFLDRNKFRKSLTVMGAQISAVKTHGMVRNTALKRHILDLRNVPKVMRDDSKSDSRIILLNAGKPSDLPSEASQCLENAGATLQERKIELTYDHWTADEIFRAVLPEELCDEAPSGFAIIGHIAHLNLNERYLPYKYIIGQVILDKNPVLKTVVNKLDTIHAEFRFFDMELIAGVPEYIVSHSEVGCTFEFNFREVYWNSRLHTEHERLVQQFGDVDGVIVDVMAGVGPFAVPAAKKGHAVLANDLNPSCYKWHKINALNNKVSETLRIYCEDGHTFIPASFKLAYEQPFPPFKGRATSNRRLKKEQKAQQKDGRKESSPAVSPSDTRKPRDRIDHFIMNLPDTAIEFLGAFRGVLTSEERRLRGLYDELPMVHCYCFTRFLDPTEAEADIRKRVEDALRDSLEDEVSLHFVRSVAPNKDMYCISFRLPRRVAHAES